MQKSQVLVSVKEPAPETEDYCTKGPFTVPKLFVPAVLPAPVEKVPPMPVPLVPPIL